MKIVIDLQACQGASRFRGIGRYSMSLAKAMIQEGMMRGHDVVVVLNEEHPEAIDEIYDELNGLLPKSKVRTFTLTSPVAEMVPDNITNARSEEVLREQFIASLKPDVIHIASLFEGWFDDVVSSVNTADLSVNTAVTFYDLIPLVLKDLYLTDPAYNAYYQRKLENLKRSSTLLAISEHSRQSAIELLDFKPEDVFNISAASDDLFKEKEYNSEQRARVLTQFNINGPFILYVPGGFDARKNFDRLVSAFAKLPNNLPNMYQLVIASKLPEGVRQDFVLTVNKLGLSSSQLVLTDYLEESELVCLYNSCELFVFPSLNEGFGLPLLEAMACGAPVIGSNLTSMPEILGWDDAMFDPYSVDSIGDKITRALTDEGFLSQLKRNSDEQMKKFSWSRSACIALDALEGSSKKQKMLGS